MLQGLDLEPYIASKLTLYAMKSLDLALYCKPTHIVCCEDSDSALAVYCKAITFSPKWLLGSQYITTMNENENNNKIVLLKYIIIISGPTIIC